MVEVIHSPFFGTEHEDSLETWKCPEKHSGGRWLKLVLHHLWTQKEMKIFTAATKMKKNARDSKSHAQESSLCAPSRTCFEPALFSLLFLRVLALVALQVARPWALRLCFSSPAEGVDH
jgi:hypothetical protein